MMKLPQSLSTTRSTAASISVVDLCAAFDLSDASGFTLPADLARRYCGPVYVLVEADAAHLVPEVDETNNVRAAPITVDCGEGTNEGSKYFVTCRQARQISAKALWNGSSKCDSDSLNT